MPISPDDLLNLASELTDETNECRLRCAASRVYYSIFHKCRIFADNNNLPKTQNANVGSHEEVIQRYLLFSDDADHSNQIEVRRIGRVLRNMKTIRKKADYNLDDEFTIGRVEEILGFLDTINETFEKIRV